MGLYINWADIVGRYKQFESKVDAEEAATDYIPYAENYVNMQLGTYYSTPFSSNNYTAKDLSIDVAFAKSIMYSDEKKARSIMERVDTTLEMLRTGVFGMMTNSGDLISQQGEPVYSKTMEYEPVFGHGNIEDFKADSSQLYDEEVARD